MLGSNPPILGWLWPRMTSKLGQMVLERGGTGGQQLLRTKTQPYLWLESADMIAQCKPKWSVGLNAGRDLSYPVLGRTKGVRVPPCKGSNWVGG